jgi:hypothetical protein
MAIYVNSKPIPGHRTNCRMHAAMEHGPAPPIFGSGMSRWFGVDINVQKTTQKLIFGHLCQLQTHPWAQNRLPRVCGDGALPHTADFGSGDVQVVWG